ncbi:hypothetical protein [Deinococcus ruber]|uniref:Uncharacterized protein n=1 Tax=Deinococcus ruber TaxID=1848197 RepID=A0A918BUP5_9DEIO|nr:hypothetical protein [Deinococcus ruber]GGQ93533.1 hypothetical protein GCM10008957_01940 [Deinococcus ruber]
MNTDIERFLRRSTRGLWGERRRQVQRELQGAVEDRCWRHQLQGCSEAEAVRRALEDLGEPAIIARGMWNTHALPRLLPSAAALVLLAGLSLTPLTRSLAQVVASPLNLTTLFCDGTSAGLKRRTQYLTRRLAQRFNHLHQSSRQDVAALCRWMASDPYEMVERDSLTATLQRQGVTVTSIPPKSWSTAVRTTPGSGEWRWLTFPGFSSPVPLIPVGQENRPLVPIYDLIYAVLNVAGLPALVHGEVNPRVTVGTTTFTLGTPQTPIYASQLRTAALARQLDPIFNAQMYKGLTNTADPYSAEINHHVGMPSLKVKLPDGAYIGAVVRDRQQASSSGPDSKVPEYLIYTTRVKSGTIALPDGLASTLQYVDSFEELRAPFKTGQQSRMMVLRLSNVSDLRNLSYLVVPLSQLP